MPTIIKANMTTLIFTRENETEEYQCLGERGLRSTIINREVPPNCSPFDSDSKVIFAPGLLTGTSAPCSGRLPIGAENLLPVATVAVGDMEGRPTRHAGRGGMGAVLTSKGVKAIVFLGKGTQKSPRNPQAYKHGFGQRSSQRRNLL